MYNFSRCRNDIIRPPLLSPSASDFEKSPRSFQCSLNYLTRKLIVHLYLSPFKPIEHTRCKRGFHLPLRMIFSCRLRFGNLNVKWQNLHLPYDSFVFEGGWHFYTADEKRTLPKVGKLNFDNEIQKILKLTEKKQKKILSDFFLD